MSFYQVMSLAELIAKANSGDLNAAQDLAVMYANPEIFPHPEIAEGNQTEAGRWSREARRLLLMAAEAGDKDAMFHLAYELDDDIPLMGLHSEEAFHWMLMAANAGSVSACAALSLVMAEKSNLHYDPAEALKWCAKAAWSDPVGVLDEQVPAIIDEIRKLAEEVNGYYKDALDGDSEAQFQMGHIFHFGHGIDSNPVEARYWWSKAAQQGHKGAKQMLSEIGEE